MLDWGPPTRLHFTLITPLKSHLQIHFRYCGLELQQMRCLEKGELSSRRNTLTLTLGTNFMLTSVSGTNGKH